MLPMKISFLLERMREQQNLLVAEHPAGQVERRRRAAGETVRDADDRMPRAIRQRLVASDEEIEIAERLVDLLHHAHAQPIRLNEFNRRDEVSRANLVGPAALLGPVLDLRQESGASDIGERGG